MRILYITSVLGYSGGSEIYCRQLIEELLARGHEIMVATTEKPLENLNVKYVLLPRPFHHALYKFFAPLFWRRVLKAARNFKPDIIQSHGNSLMGLIGHMIKNELKIPHVLLIELISSQNYTLHTKIVFQTEKFLLPKLNYDKLIVWTENMKKKFLLPWGIAEEKIFVQPAALRIEDYDITLRGEEFRKKYGENLIVSIKTLWKTNAKGLEYIIKAMKKVHEVHPDWKYVIFGSGSGEKHLRNFTKNLGLENVVIFHGAVPSFKAKEAIAAAKICPHSFVYEVSTSISLLECMAMGKPCIVTDIGSVREVVKDSVLVIPAEDENAMANAIIKLIEDENLRKELGKKARKLCEEKYSIKATVDNLEKIYGELLNAKKII